MSQGKLSSQLVWMLANIGGSQAIRLGGNLVLTRLLAPEMFGVMVLINTFVIGASMFSDVGVRDSIITHKDSSKPSFYNTAWTVELGRGFLMCLVLVGLSVPLSAVYGIEELVTLMLIGSSSVLITAATPTKVYWQSKLMNFKGLAIVELCSQVIGISLMVFLAWYLRSVWALVIGSVATALLKQVFYVVFIPGPGNKIAWDKNYFLDIFRYGRWIILSTGSMFLVTQGDRLVVGKYLDLETLGIYSIAINFSMLVYEVGEQVGHKFLFPLYRQVVESNLGLSKVRIYRLRGLLLGFLAASPFLFGGQWIVALLYDDRYLSAGPILQVLTLGAVFRLMDTTIRQMFVAQRDSFSSMVYQCCKAVVYIVALVFAVSHFGVSGLVVVIVLVPILNMVLLHWMVAKYGYKWHFDDVIIIGAFSLVTFLVWEYLMINPVRTLFVHGM